MIRYRPAVPKPSLASVTGRDKQQHANADCAIGYPPICFFFSSSTQ